MDEIQELERARIKAFFQLLVDRLGAAAWAKRKAAFEGKVRDRELLIDLAMPIESQLFQPKENDIDWVILVADLAWDCKYSDCAYSSKRIYPYALAIGAVADQLRDVPNVNGVLNKMLANNNQPENQLFELLTASFYLKNGYEVSFIPENSILWPDGKTKKSPDMLVKSEDAEFYVECKRAGSQTQYAQTEEKAWAAVWERLSAHMLAVAPWSRVDLTFHDQVANVSPEEVIKVVDLAMGRGGRRVREGSVTALIHDIDFRYLRAHYLFNSVKPNSPQQELLVFGDTDSNEKRSIATVASSIVRPGEPETILNIFVEGVANCVGAQWRCDHSISKDARSKHFKSLVNAAVSQIPPDKPGVVHVWYETREGVEVEEQRSDKNRKEIAAYDASSTTVLGTFVHGVSFYPSATDYEWAETVADFLRERDVRRFYRQSLMLATENTVEVEGTTHWEQDKAARSGRRSSWIARIFSTLFGGRI